MTEHTPRLIVVAGSGRSGTSTISGVLKYLGLTIPQPEIPSNPTNPKGFFEPQWAVNFQSKLLIRANVVLSDGRPAAFDQTLKAGASAWAHERVDPWVAEWLGKADEVLVKDPRSSWFLPMWRDAAEAAGGEIAYLTMMRHPAEVVGSKDKYYKHAASGDTIRAQQTNRVAGWLNIALFTELQTRGARRTFVRYPDLLEDWQKAVATVGEDLDLAFRHGMSEDVVQQVNEFIDPDLRRVRTEWSDIDAPEEVKELAEETWNALSVLVGTGGSDSEAEARLDAAREHFVTMYADAEAIAQSSAGLAKRRAIRDTKAQTAQRIARLEAELAAARSGRGAARILADKVQTRARAALKR